MSDLPDEIYEQVIKLSESGNVASDKGKFDLALSRFEEAYALLPEPKSFWEASTWLLVAIGDTLFAQAKISEACRYFQEARKTPGGNENPFIFLRLGQCFYDLNNHQQAAEALTDAYMLAGVKIFSQEDPKYYSFLKTKLKLKR